MGSTQSRSKHQKNQLPQQCFYMHGRWRRLHGAEPVPPPAPSSGTPSTTAASGGGSSDNKVPKTLPPGKWTELVNRYNSITVGSKTRSFPAREVLGAEAVIARLWHERHISHLYTPLQLCEILQHRSFTASGDINPLMKTSKKFNLAQVRAKKLPERSP